MKYKVLSKTELKKPIVSDKRAEKRAKALLENKNYTVFRSDFRNYFPDYYCSKKNSTFFVEVKNYRSCEAIEFAWKKYLSLKEQHNQREHIQRLVNSGTKVYYFFFTSAYLYKLQVLKT